MPSNQEIHIEPYCEIDFGISFQTFEYSTIKNYVWTRLISIFPAIFSVNKIKKKKKVSLTEQNVNMWRHCSRHFEKFKLGLDEKI